MKWFLTHSLRFLLIVCVVGLHSSLVGKESIHYNKKELRQLMQRAKTVDDCKLLIAYFLSEERAYRAKAQSDQKKYQQALHTMSIPKYPTPADTAKWFYQYDVYKANQMAKFAIQYEQKLEELGAPPKSSS